MTFVYAKDKRKGIYVEGLSEWIVRTPREIYDLMKLGGAMRWVLHYR